VIAGVEPFRNLPDALAEGFSIPEISRPREHVDLRAGVVDVILARNVVTGEREQVGQRIAKHRATAVPDMHRSCRIGGDVFDVDLSAAANDAFPIAVTLTQYGAQRLHPGRWLQGDIDEARTGDL